MTLKLPRTKSRTDTSCFEVNTIQEPDEIAEPETEEISKEVSETHSLGSNKGNYNLQHYIEFVNCIYNIIRRKQLSG